MTALQKLLAANSKDKYICVGLDTDLNKLPESVLSVNNPVLEFNRRIIDATKEHAASYKINFAFYEAAGIDGLRTLESTLKLIPSDILTIGDAKRGDIGNTSKMYAQSIFEIFGFDSVTLHPYMGFDSLSPFIEFSDKLNFILALTSNPGSNDFEKLLLSDGSFVYQKVISTIHSWNKNANCGIVFGATKIDELSRNSELIGDLPVLLPGVGAQGGKLEDVVLEFKRIQRKSYLINVSRGILYKDSSEKFDSAAADEINSMNSQISFLLK